MFGSLLDTGLRGVGLDVVAVAAVFLILGLVALLRCRKEDIPAVVRPWRHGGESPSRQVPWNAVKDAPASAARRHQQRLAAGAARESSTRAAASASHWAVGHSRPSSKRPVADRSSYGAFLFSAWHCEDGPRRPQNDRMGRFYYFTIL